MIVFFSSIIRYREDSSLLGSEVITKSISEMATLFPNFSLNQGLNALGLVPVASFLTNIVYTYDWI